MKKNMIVIPMVVSWFLFIALDSTAGLFRTGYSGKIKRPFQAIYMVINSIRAVTIFIIAILNFILVTSFLGKTR